MNDDYSFFSNRTRLLNRRGFVKAGGSLVALGTLPAYLSANPDHLQSTLRELQEKQGVVLYRADDAHSVAFASTLARGGMNTVALTDDPVRQWRDGLGEIAGKRGMPVLGLTCWPDYLLINGLAAEKRKLVQLEMQHAVEQEEDNWAAGLALGYLQLPADADRQKIQSLAGKFLGEESIRPGISSLFSWMIA